MPEKPYLLRWKSLQKGKSQKKTLLSHHTNVCFTRWPIPLRYFLGACTVSKISHFLFHWLVQWKVSTVKNVSAYMYSCVVSSQAECWRWTGHVLGRQSNARRHCFCYKWVMKTLNKKKRRWITNPYRFKWSHDGRKINLREYIPQKLDMMGTSLLLQASLMS